MGCEKSTYLLHNMLEQAFYRVMDLSALFNIKIKKTGKPSPQLLVAGNLEDDINYMSVCLRTIIQCSHLDSDIKVSHNATRSFYAIRLLIRPTINTEIILPLLSTRLECFRHASFHIRCLTAGEQRLSIDIDIPLSS